MPTLQEAIVRHGPDHVRRFGAAMPPWHRRALERLAACRTPAAGRLYHQCACCGGWQVTPASCGHRACAQCGLHKARQWEAAQQAKGLPVSYVMVTFTLPSALRQLFRSHQRICYDLFMKESGAALLEMGRDPRHLGGEIGATGVLHTWRRDLGYHPHVHWLLPAGALGPRGWISPKKPDYFLPSAVLAVRLRNRFRDRLRTQHPALWRRVPNGAWQKPWNVHVQFVGRGESAVRYLSRYVQSTAIRNSRMVAVSDKTVTYQWTDRLSGQRRQETVSGGEFLRRFLQHVLPKGVVRVRHIGFLSAAAKKAFAAARAAARAAVGVAASVPDAGPPPTAGPPAEAAGSTGFRCAACQAAMQFVEFRTAQQPGHPEGLHRHKQQEPAPRHPPAPLHTAAARQAAVPVRGPPAPPASPPIHGAPDFQP